MWIAVTNKWKSFATILIIALIFIVNVRWKRIEGDFREKEYFPLNHFVVTESRYLDVLADQITIVSLMLVVWMESKIKEMKLVFFLFVGRLIDYFLEGGRGWGHLSGKVVSFDSLMFVAFGIILINKLWETLKSEY